MSARETLYQAHVLDHALHSKHRGSLPGVSGVRGENPSCGDTLTLYLSFQGETLLRATFMGSGCAISQAAASLLVERITGATLQEMRSLSEEEAIALLGVPITSGRRPCALLAYRALKKALSIKG